MDTVKLTNPTLSVEHPDGQVYTLADPIEFIVGLAEDGFLDVTGAVNNDPKSLATLREKVKTAFGFPSLTYPQLMQILEAVKSFVEGFQKKTPSSVTSPNATASSRPKMPSA